MIARHECFTGETGLYTALFPQSVAIDKALHVLRQYTLFGQRIYTRRPPLKPLLTYNHEKSLLNVQGGELRCGWYSSVSSWIMDGKFREWPVAAPDLFCAVRESRRLCVQNMPDCCSSNTRIMTYLFLYNRLHGFNVEGVSAFKYCPSRIRPYERPLTGWMVYIDFATGEEAEIALQQLHDLEFNGRQLVVMVAGFRDIDGSINTGSAKPSNQQACEEAGIRRALLGKKDRSLWGSPESVIGLLDQKLPTRNPKRLGRTPKAAKTP